FDEEIELVAALQLQALVHHGKIHLAPEHDSPRPELVLETLLISRFKQSRSKSPVNLDGRPYDRLRQLPLQQHQSPPLFLSVSPCLRGEYVLRRLATSSGSGRRPVR